MSIATAVYLVPFQSFSRTARGRLPSGARSALLRLAAVLGPAGEVEISATDVQTQFLVRTAPAHKNCVWTIRSRDSRPGHAGIRRGKFGAILEKKHTAAPTRRRSAAPPTLERGRALRIPVTIERHREGFQSDNSFLPLRAAPTKLGTNPPLSNEGKSRPAAGASPAMPPLPPGSAGLREGRTDRRTDGRTDGLPHPRRSRPGGGGGPRGSEFPRGAESAARGGGAGGSAGLGAPLHLLPAGTSPSRAGPGRAEPALTRVLHVVSSREGPKSAREGCARRGSAGCAGAGQGF